MEALIIRAVPEDAPSIQEVYYRTWLATYPNKEAGVTVADIEELWRERHSELGLKWRIRQILRPPPGRTMLLAKKPDSMLIGICVVVCTNEKNEVQTLYVLPEYQGHGIGDKLLEAAGEYLDPARPTMLQVADYNADAIRFYTRHGFADTGMRFMDPQFVFASGARIHAIEMRRPALQGAPS